jgi:hypothetical protein
MSKSVEELFFELHQDPAFNFSYEGIAKRWHGTEGCWYQAGYEAAKKALSIQQEADAKDTKRLDWLESVKQPYMLWIARPSVTGRGYRLHQDPSIGKHTTAREAIDTAMATQQS